MVYGNGKRLLNNEEKQILPERRGVLQKYVTNGLAK